MSRQADIDNSRKVFKNLGRRAILPLVPHPNSKLAANDDSLATLRNVQGDVIYLFPKKAENFIFFRISNVAAFKTALKSFKPTSSEDVKEHLLNINDAKDTGAATVDIAQYQIAFTRMGLNFLGVKENTGDVRFDTRCMRDDKSLLGDGGQWDSIFEKTPFDEKNGSVKNDTNALHGVITVAGGSPENCKTASEGVTKLFGSSMTVAGGAPVEGRTRPGDYKGHEHFGFMDGISQPAPRGLVAPRPGQIEVDPGVLLMGHPGDPVLDDPNIKVKRPSWTKDGTMLVYRQLSQDVVGFENYVAEKGKDWKNFVPGGPDGNHPPDIDGPGLFGARLIGRWKSGAPLAKCPFKDDQAMADDPDRNNDFDYVVRDVPTISADGPSDYYCPFTIHTRKTAPRNLSPYIDPKFLESSSIVRGGLPYGPEVTDDERRKYSLADPNNYQRRGLLFNCYSSSLDSGFIRQTGFAGNDFFPMTSLVPEKHGQDPILGSGSNDFFVTSHGGEYFFVPSISTLNSWAIGPASGSSLLDILFLLDATGSMQQYIDQVRNNLQQMCDTLVATGKWARRDLRFGCVTFRDHPPEEDTFVTKKYPFDSDPRAVQSNLALVEAAGGGDGPEAQCDALHDALTVGWKKDAIKIAVLITDSPPHGIKEEEDGFPKGCPLQNDPIRSAKRMAALGITLHVLACEPALSTDYATPLDFYTHLAERTGGKLFGVADIQALIDLITGSAVETAAINALAVTHGTNIRLSARSGAASEQISQNLHQRLSASAVKVHTVDAEHIYEENADGDHNVKTWHLAESIDDPVLSQLKEVNDFRLKSEYLSGGTQPINLKEQPVSLDQVKRVVTKSLASVA